MKTTSKPRENWKVPSQIQLTSRMQMLWVSQSKPVMGNPTMPIIYIIQALKEPKMPHDCPNWSSLVQRTHGEDRGSHSFWTMHLVLRMWKLAWGWEKLGLQIQLENIYSKAKWLRWVSQDRLLRPTLQLTCCMFCRLFITTPLKLSSVKWR